MVKENAVGAVGPATFVAVTSIVDTPAIVGTPLKSPVEVNVNPSGNPVAPQVIGVVPLAANWKGV
jgi:hypothetical protein